MVMLDLLCVENCVAWMGFSRASNKVLLGRVSVVSQGLLDPSCVANKMCKYSAAGSPLCCE